MNTLLPAKTITNSIKLATPKQLATLATLGYAGDTVALTLAGASKAIERLIAERKAQTDAIVEDAKRQVEHLSALSLFEGRTELHKVTAKEWAGPCPKCGGHDRFHVTEQWFFCRQCHEKRGDYIESVQWLDGCSYVEACVKITGNSVSPISHPAQQVRPVAKVATASDWDEPKQRGEALEAHGKLLSSTGKQATIAQDYLAGRGISLETIKAFSIGYSAVGLPNTYDKQKRSRCYPMQVAISLPWFNHDGAWQCVKYRFTELHTYTDLGGKERTEGKTSRGQSSGHMFGWQALQGPGKRAALIICEGEMNALSLWQVCGGWADVLSAGSESVMSTLPKQVVDLAAQYQHKVVWADKGGIANKAAVGIRAASMRSPAGPDGKEVDANDLLQAGRLAGLVDAMRKRLGIEANGLTV